MTMPDNSALRTVASHIQILDENTQGEDFLMGDLHGRCDLLNLVLSKLDRKDRLFIAGDLVDRGPQSYELIETIIKINKDCENQNLPPRIHAALGNHEELFLRFCDTKKKQQLALSELAAKKTIYEQSLKKLDLEKAINPSLANQLTPAHHQTVTAHNQLIQGLENYKTKRAAYDKLTVYLIQLGGSWATSLDDQKLAALETYFSSLPYLIHVAGKEPFNLVHADLPFSNSELKARIQIGKLNLSAEECHYMIWARENDLELPIKNKKEDHKGPLTYCGHTIGGGVRNESRHLNLDIGSYFSSCVCLVGHKNKTCEILGDPKNLNLKLSDNEMTPENLKNEIMGFFNDANSSTTN